MICHASRFSSGALVSWTVLMTKRPLALQESPAILLSLNSIHAAPAHLKNNPFAHGEDPFHKWNRRRSLSQTERDDAVPWVSCNHQPLSQHHGNPSSCLSGGVECTTFQSFVLPNGDLAVLPCISVFRRCFLFLRWCETSLLIRRVMNVSFFPSRGLLSCSEWSSEPLGIFRGSKKEAPIRKWRRAKGRALILRGSCQFWLLRNCALVALLRLGPGVGCVPVGYRRNSLHLEASGVSWLEWSYLPTIGSAHNRSTRV